MATRVNLMKLLQEVRGFEEFANRSFSARPVLPLLLQLKIPGARLAPPKRKRLIQVQIQNPPDIPTPVPIVYRGTVETVH